MDWGKCSIKVPRYLGYGLMVYFPVTNIVQIIRMVFISHLLIGQHLPFPELYEGVFIQILKSKDTPHTPFDRIYKNIDLNKRCTISSRQMSGTETSQSILGYYRTMIGTKWGRKTKHSTFQFQFKFIYLRRYLRIFKYSQIYIKLYNDYSSKSSYN